MQILCNQKVTPRIPFNKTKALFAPLPRLGRFVSTRSQIVQAVEEAKEGAPVTTGAGEYQWTFQCTDGPEVGAKGGRGRIIKELPVSSVIRPFFRENNQDKVAALMVSIEEVGLQEPIDVLEVEGKIYGFSGCHRYEAHQRLGKETILCRVRKANQSVLRAHMA